MLSDVSSKIKNISTLQYKEKNLSIGARLPMRPEKDGTKIPCPKG